MDAHSQTDWSALMVFSSSSSSLYSLLVFQVSFDIRRSPLVSLPPSLLIKRRRRRVCAKEGITFPKIRNRSCCCWLSPMGGCTEQHQFTFCNPRRRRATRTGHHHLTAYLLLASYDPPLQPRMRSFFSHPHRLSGGGVTPGRSVRTVTR